MPTDTMFVRDSHGVLVRNWLAKGYRSGGPWMCWVYTSFRMGRGQVHGQV